MKKETISTKMLKKYTVKELSTTSGKTEELTPDEEKERLNAIYETMTTFN